MSKKKLAVKEFKLNETTFVEFVKCTVGYVNGDTAWLFALEDGLDEDGRRYFKGCAYATMDQTGKHTIL